MWQISTNDFENNTVFASGLIIRNSLRPTVINKR